MILFRYVFLSDINDLDLRYISGRLQQIEL